MLHSLIISLAALVSVALTGCAVPAGVYGFGAFKVTSFGLSDQRIAEELARHQRPIDDPNGYVRYLESREFVIDDAVFDAYACTIDSLVASGWFTPDGGYAGASYLDTNIEKKAFRKRLEELGFSPNAISFYESLFTSWDTIIFRESILQEEFFLKALPHERLHKAMKRLGGGEYQAMRRAVKELMARRVPLTEPMEFVIDGRKVVLTDEWFVKELWYLDKTSFGAYFAAASMNWEEFYTYLAQGEFEASAEEALASDYPEQYAIFSRLREQCALKSSK